MNSTPASGLRCTVQGEENLPPGLGGEAGVCASIVGAVLPALQHGGIPAESVVIAVRVKSRNSMSAVAKVHDQTLPEQTVGVMDRPLNERAVKMLAQAVAGELAKLRD